MLSIHRHFSSLPFPSLPFTSVCSLPLRPPTTPRPTTPSSYTPNKSWPFLTRSRSASRQSRRAGIGAITPKPTGAITRLGRPPRTSHRCVERHGRRHAPLPRARPGGRGAGYRHQLRLRVSGEVLPRSAQRATGVAVNKGVQHISLPGPSRAPYAAEID